MTQTNQVKWFSSCKISIFPCVTLTLKLHLAMVKMYHHTKNEVCMSTASEVIAWTFIQTDRHTHTTKTLLPSHTQEVKITDSKVISRTDRKTDGQRLWNITSRINGSYRSNLVCSVCVPVYGFQPVQHEWTDSVSGIWWVTLGTSHPDHPVPPVPPDPLLHRHGTHGSYTRTSTISLLFHIWLTFRVLHGKVLKI